MPSKRNWNNMYETYEREYYKKVKTTGVFEEKLSPYDFREQYTALYNASKQEIANGKRKKMPNVTRDLVNRQAYTVSRDQARGYFAIAKASYEEKVEQLKANMVAEAVAKGMDINDPALIKQMKSKIAEIAIPKFKDFYSTSISAKEIRETRVDNAFLSKRYRENIAKGMSAIEAWHEISVTFYGSPE